MARAATATSGGGGRKAPAAASTTTVWDDLYAVIKENDPDFADPKARETDQAFMKRVVKAVSDLPEEVILPAEVEAWYEGAADQYEQGAEITPPAGFTDEEAGNEEAEAAPNGNGAAPPKRTGAQALAEYNARRRAEKAAKEAGAQPAAGTTPRRRGAAPAQQEQQPAAAAPRRKAAAAPAAQPAAAPRRKAAAPPPAAPTRHKANAAAEPAESVSRFIRIFVLHNPDCTPSEAAAAATDAGYSPQASTVGGLVTFTKNTVAVMKELGYYKQPRT